MDKADFELHLSDLERAFAAQAPELEVTVRDPELGLEGYVVVWNTGPSVGGPLERCGKGGTRITPSVDLAEVRMLAKTMALKNAAAGLPLGGAKSGLRADPDAPDFEARYRRFVRLTKSLLFENGGIWGGYGFDIGARPCLPYWAIDELGSGRSFTGKPLELGGTDYDREGVAGLGVAVAARTLLAARGVPVAGATAAVQGAGAMGAAVARYFSEYGGIVRCLADPRLGGCFELPQGLLAADIESLAAGNLTQLGERFRGRGLVPTAVDDVLFTPVDVLFPCALQGVITANNRDRLSARFIVEGANNPMDDECRQVLADRGVQIIPDFIANPGGVIAAFVEMTSTISLEENVKTRGKVVAAKHLTEEKIQENVFRVLALADSVGVSATRAARYIALQLLV